MNPEGSNVSALPSLTYNFKPKISQPTYVQELQRVVSEKHQRLNGCELGMEQNYTESSFLDNSTLYIAHDYPIPWGPVSTLIAVLIFGTLANSSIIYIVLKNKRLRSTPNAIVVSLAVGDLLCLNVNLPFMLYYHVKDAKEWLFGAVLCKITMCSFVASGCITVFSLMALAIERYLAIACPWRSRESNRCMRFSRKCCLFPTSMIVFSTWLAAFIVGAPLLIEAHIVVFNDQPRCLAANHGTRSSSRYKLFRVLAAYILPLVTIVVAHALTAYALVKSIREPITGSDQVYHGHRQSNRVRSRVKLAFVISVLSFLFFVAWLPFYVYDIWFEFFFHLMPLNNAMLGFFRWKDIPIYMLSSLNPVVLYILSTRFREHLFKDCFCCAGDSWRTMDGLASLKTSLTQTTFRAGRSMVSRKSSPSKHDRAVAPSHELTRL